MLVAVSPEQRVVEVLTGPEARLRLPDRGAKLAVMSMVASFKEGDLFGGLLSGLRMLADQAGGRAAPADRRPAARRGRYRRRRPSRTAHRSARPHRALVGCR